MFVCVGSSNLYNLLQASCFSWTQRRVALVVIVNQNGMCITIRKLGNVMNKNRRVHVLLDNILLIMPLHDPQNAVVLKTLSTIQTRAHALNSTLKGSVRKDRYIKRLMGNSLSSYLYVTFTHSILGTY